ncbi:MAG: hypothetical protein K2X69_03840, partial [Silvanigrellaceae bacterium]|nr:hypothetical protein [Silvanigrellaceae bacterium]
MKKLGKRATHKNDLNSIDYVNETLNNKDNYPEFKEAIPLLRKSPFRSLLTFEKKQFIFMFFIHVSDVIASLISALTAIQLLRSFESPSENFRLISLFYQNP